MVLQATIQRYIADEKYRTDLLHVDLTSLRAILDGALEPDTLHFMYDAYILDSTTTLLGPRDLAIALTLKLVLDVAKKLPTKQGPSSPEIATLLRFYNVGTERHRFSSPCPGRLSTLDASNYPSVLRMCILALCAEVAVTTFVMTRWCEDISDLAYAQCGALLLHSQITLGALATLCTHCSECGSARRDYDCVTASKNAREHLTSIASKDALWEVPGLV